MHWRGSEPVNIRYAYDRLRLAFRLLLFLALSGSLATGAFDASNSNSAVSTGTGQAGSTTPAVNDEFLLAILGTDDPALSATPEIDSGFTVSQFVDGVAGSQYGMAAATFTQTTAGSVNPTWTRPQANTAGHSDVYAVLSFKPAPGGGVMGNGLWLPRWRRRSPPRYGVWPGPNLG